MSSSVKSFSVGYNPINKSNIFISGDCITGQITLEMEKRCTIDSLCIKLKGKAEVKWTEQHGKQSVTYYAKVKYFSIKQFVIEKGKGNTTLGQGCNVYPFTFQIPAQELPSSFKDTYGKIAYTLEANLSRSMRVDSRVKEKFTLSHNWNLNSDPTLMSPQQDITEKKLRLFASGTVSMDANIERTGFHQGEGIKVVASIHNKSSRDIRPKYCLYKKCSYFAKGRRKVQTKDILKEVGDPIPPSAGQTVTRVITIPPDTCVSILNCIILRVEYRLRVYLDVKYASDPEIKFPVVILPALQGPDGEHLPAYPTYGYEGYAVAGSGMPGGTGFLQNQTASGPFAPPPPYETYGTYPPLSDFNEKS
ncbi:arrestin domain-containing protein 3-like [Acanthopagrus schlegelii]